MLSPIRITKGLISNFQCSLLHRLDKKKAGEISKQVLPVALISIIGGSEEYLPTETIRNQLKTGLLQILKTISKLYHVQCHFNCLTIMQLWGLIYLKNYTMMQKINFSIHNFFVIVNFDITLTWVNNFDHQTPQRAIIVY